MPVYYAIHTTMFYSFLTRGADFLFISNVLKFVIVIAHYSRKCVKKGVKLCLLEYKVYFCIINSK